MNLFICALLYLFLPSVELEITAFENDRRCGAARPSLLLFDFHATFQECLPRRSTNVYRESPKIHASAFDVYDASGAIPSLKFVGTTAAATLDVCCHFA